MDSCDICGTTAHATDDCDNVRALHAALDEAEDDVERYLLRAERAEDGARADRTALAKALHERDEMRAERDELRGFSDADPVVWQETLLGFVDVRGWSALRGRARVAHARRWDHARRWEADGLWEWSAGVHSGTAPTLDEAQRDAERALGWERP